MNKSKRSISGSLTLLLTGMLLFASSDVVASTALRTPDPIPGYHNFDALTRALRTAVASKPNLASISSIGKSIGGRDIWVVEVGNQGGTPRADRPALLIVANLEGNQLVGSELSLQIVDYLLENYGSDDAVTSQLDNATFYIIPRANPDGAEHMFARLQTGQAGNDKPMDDDNDGRTNEDAPNDLNGDGFISVMRVKDSMGEYMIDPADARAMKKADPKKGESGVYKIYWEGTDDDGDGFYNEDPLGGVNLNRNFQHEYPYYTVGAGPHMISENETRAIMDFVISHRNISAILTFSPNDNLVTAPNNKGELAPAMSALLPAFAAESNADSRKVGIVEVQRPRFFGGGGGGQSARTGRPSSGRRPETTVNKDDQEYFKAVSDKYKELVGVSTVPSVEKPAGAFFEYGYYQFGVPSFATPGWGLDAAKSDASADSAAAGSRGRGGAAGRPSGDSDKASVDVTLLKWMDSQGIDGFIPWTAHKHPTLGDVEIGGFKPYEFLNPPNSVIEELGPKHGAFVVELASMFAEVRIAETTVTDHGGGVFRIKAEIENAGYFPTSSAHGVVSRSVKPTMVQLDIDPDALLSGAAKTSFFQALDGSGKRTSFEWLIKGKKGDSVAVKVVSQKGGSATANVTLR